MPAKYYKSRSKKAAPTGSISAKDTKTGLPATATETAIQARDRGVPFGPTPTTPSGSSKTTPASTTSQQGTPSPKNDALAGFQNNPFFDTTGKPAAQPMDVLKNNPMIDTTGKPAAQTKQQAPQGIVAQFVDDYWRSQGKAATNPDGTVTYDTTRVFRDGSLTKMLTGLGFTAGTVQVLQPGTVPVAGGVSAQGWSTFVQSAMKSVGKLPVKPWQVLAVLGVVWGAVKVAETIFDKTKGSQQFGQFLGEEGTGSLGMASWIASEAGRDDLALEALQAQEQAIAAAREIQANPLAPTEGLKQYFDSLEKGNKITQTVLKDKLANPQMTYLEQASLVEEKKTAEANARTDYYNQQGKILFDYEQAVLAKMRSEASSSRKRQMEEEAAFWRKQKEEMFKLEEEERKRQAEFWLEYKKTVLFLERRAREEQGSSTLHFGLLR